MNAYELADALQETEPYYSTDYKLFDNAANMLRQLQAENDALKWEINHLEQSVDSLRTTLFDIKQKYDTKNKHYVYTQVYVDELQAKIEALQFPPQTKPLSDEEIKELIVNKVTDYELCRAIEERHGIK